MSLPADHAGFMVWGVMGSGVFGFLLTAYPRQNDAPMPGPRLLSGLWIAQLTAAILLLFGRSVLPAGVRALMLLLPWVTSLAWAVPIAGAALKRRWDPTTAAVPVALGAAAVGVALHAFGATAVRGISIGVGPFLVLLALAVIDRVLPFFSRGTPGYDGRRSPWFLGPLAALLWIRATTPTPIPLVSAGLLVLLLRQWWGWRPWPAARAPMVGVIHLGLGWFALAFFAEVLGAPATVVTHAMLVGGMGTLLLGISMRVVRGHSGLPVVLGRAGAVILLLAQLAAAIRVWTGWAGGEPMAYIASALLLVSAFGMWLLLFRATLPRASRDAA